MSARKNNEKAKMTKKYQVSDCNDETSQAVTLAT